MEITRVKANAIKKEQMAGRALVFVVTFYEVFKGGAPNDSKGTIFKIPI